MLTRSEHETGRAIAEAVWGSQIWCHRKVDSLRLLEGDRGRRRVSLDCTPPPEPGLTYGVPSRRRFRRHEPGPIRLPVAMISKGAMRDLDATLGDGTPVPVLGRQENGELAYLALAYALQRVLGDLPRPLARVLERIVREDSRSARRLANALVREGSVGGQQILDPSVVPEGVKDLILDLASNFLLVLVLPAECVGTRTVVKYSFHWRSIPPTRTRSRRVDSTAATLEPADSGAVSYVRGRTRRGWRTFRRRIRDVRERWATGLGYGTALFELEAGDPSWASSYHLEVHAPVSLACERLALPAPYQGAAAAGVDNQIGTVAHAYAAYPESPPPRPTAKLSLGVPLQGLRQITLLVTAFTALVFQLEEHLPGARQALLAAPDGAVAILLAVPAVVIALMVRFDENRLATVLLRPLRVVVLGCAALLVSAAASLVGWLHEPYIAWLWAVGAWSSTAAFLVMLVPSLTRRTVRGVG